MQRSLVAASRVAAQVGASSRRSASSSGRSALASAYSVIGASNVTYVTYIVGGVIVLEAVYGTITDGIWSSMNKGRTFQSTDWSKFASQFSGE
jgi:hypothetical protein